MHDMCKSAGWPRIYWRVFDGGRVCYESKLLLPMGKWDDDGFWPPKSDWDKTLLQGYMPNMSPEQRRVYYSLIGVGGGKIEDVQKVARRLLALGETDVGTVKKVSLLPATFQKSSASR